MSGKPDPSPITRAQQVIDKAAPAAKQTATDGASAQNGGNDVLEEVTNVLAVDPPSGQWISVAFGILVVGTLLAYLVWRWVKPADFMPSSDYAVYAGMFVMALAIERILEPFSGLFIPSIKEKKARSNATAAHARLTGAAALNGLPPPSTGGPPADYPPADAGGQPPAATATSVARAQQAAAVAQKEFHRSQTDRAVLMWATASVLAMLACAALGIFLLRSIETPGPVKRSTTSTSVSSSAPSPAKDPNRLLDLIATGLVVGAGTKPLHDLISQIQTSSGKSKAPSAAASG
jgi:hypothetical protein